MMFGRQTFLVSADGSLIVKEIFSLPSQKRNKVFMVISYKLLQEYFISTYRIFYFAPSFLGILFLS